MNCSGCFRESSSHLVKAAAIDFLVVIILQGSERTFGDKNSRLLVRANRVLQVADEIRLLQLDGPDDIDGSHFAARQAVLNGAGE
jgi:hypothetical protein